jgi:glucose/mannose-6-phosphate isomerase
MLDDLKLIHERDDYDVQYNETAPIHNVVLAGMGGSGWPALILKSWPGVSVPFQVVNDYDIPEFVNENTLFISSSYSGNTEETISALHEAEAKNAQIIILAAGGKLVDIAKEGRYPLYLIPGGIQPRMSSFYFLAALIQMLEPLALVRAGSLEEMRLASTWLHEQTANWETTVPTAQNPAKQLALELVGKSIVVYSGPKLFPAANMWKICMNENAKNVAWTNQYPELNHNEFIGWSSHPTEKPYAVVEIRSELEHPRVQKRFVVTERLLSGKRPAPEVVVPQGETILEQLLWSFNFGGYVSLYVALLNGLNPTPVDLVEDLKREMNN